METIFINGETTPFILARWLYLKQKIKQSEMKEYMEKSSDELISILNDFGYKVKVRGKKETVFAPTDSELFE